MVGSTQNSSTSTMPQEFVIETRKVAFDAATRIAEVLQEAQDRGAHVVAPFTGYCAFNASLVHLVRMFDSQAGAQEEAKKHMETCLKFLLQMKQYWGLFQSITDSLKLLYKKFLESSLRGNNLATHADISRMLQYGDWFLKFPQGFQSEDVAEDPTKGRIPGDMRSPSDDAALSHRPDLQTADDFFSRLGPRQPALSADAANHMENFMRSPSDARSSPGHVQSPTVLAGNSMQQQSPPMHTPPPGTMNTPSLVPKPAAERPMNVDTHKSAHVRRSSIPQPSPSTAYARNFGTQGATASQLTSPLSARLPGMPTTSAAQFSNYAQQVLTARAPVTQGGGGGVHFNHQPQQQQQQQPVSQEQTSQPPYLYDTDSGLIAALSTGLWQGYDQPMNTADVSGFPEHQHHHHHHQTTGSSAWFMPFNSVAPEFESTHTGLDTLGMLAASSGLVEGGRGGGGGWQGQRQQRRREGQEAVVKPEYHRDNVPAADSGNGDMM
jgi:hypothetical protein